MGIFHFLIVVQAIVAASLVGVILMQRSEGGGLGMGGSPSGLMSARGAADFLTRMTTILATVFIVLSISLAFVAAKKGGTAKSIAALSVLKCLRLQRHQRRLRQQLPLRRPLQLKFRSISNRFGTKKRFLHRLFFGEWIRSLVFYRKRVLSLFSHGTVHFYHRWRGILAWQRSYGSIACCPFAGARIPRSNPEVRSLSQC